VYRGKQLPSFATDDKTNVILFVAEFEPIRVDVFMRGTNVINTRFVPPPEDEVESTPLGSKQPEALRRPPASSTGAEAEMRPRQEAEMRLVMSDLAVSPSPPPPHTHSVRPTARPPAQLCPDCESDYAHHTSPTHHPQNSGDKLLDRTIKGLHEASVMAL